MNDRPNFSSILDESPNEVSYPPAWPVGTYVCVAKSWEEITSSKKGTPGIRWTLHPIQAGDDVDEDELKEFGGLGERTIVYDIWLTEKSVFGLDELHQNCGVDLSVPMSRRLRNDECINAQVGVYMKQEPNMDGTRMVSRVARSVPVE